MPKSEAVIRLTQTNCFRLLSSIRRRGTGCGVRKDEVTPIRDSGGEPGDTIPDDHNARFGASLYGASGALRQECGLLTIS
jgi:hypothetical protein